MSQHLEISGGDDLDPVEVVPQPEVVGPAVVVLRPDGLQGGVALIGRVVGGHCPLEKCIAQNPPPLLDKHRYGHYQVLK